MTKPYTKLKRFWRPSSAKIARKEYSASDALPVPFLDRVSAFETMRAYRGRIFYWKDHLERLIQSCAALGQSLPCSPGAAEIWVQSALRESKQSDASLRLSVHWSNEGESALLLISRPFVSHPEIWYQKGVTLRTASARRWTLRAQDPQIKASQYVSGVLATLDKGALPAHELLFLGPSGTVAEGTVSNLFILQGRTLLTPSVGSGILRGVTRGIVLGLAKKRGWLVKETPLTRHDFYAADECFLTNTSSEVLPVVEIDGRRIGRGRPGKYTQCLAGDFKKLR